MVLLRVVQALRRGNDGVSPVDKLEFLFKETDILDYAFDDKGHICYLKNDYLFIKHIERHSKEPKSVLNVKISEQLDRVMHMKNFVLFDSNDITTNQVIDPSAKYSKTSVETVEMPEFSTRPLGYKVSGQTHLMVFEGLFVVINKLKAIYKENVIYSYFFHNVLFYQNSISLYAIIPYFEIDDKPLKLQVTLNANLPLHTISMIRLIKGKVFVLNDKLESAIIDIEDQLLLTAVLLEIGEYKTMLDIVNKMPLDQQFMVAKGLIRKELINILFKFRNMEQLVIMLARVVEKLNPCAVKEFISKARVYLSFIGNNELTRRFTEALENNSLEKRNEVSRGSINPI